jgi:hypothetical protein
LKSLELRGKSWKQTGYPLAIAADDLKQKFGGIEGIPTTVTYDRNGVLRNKIIGFEYTDVIEPNVKPLL